MGLQNSGMEKTEADIALEKLNFNSPAKPPPVQNDEQSRRDAYLAKQQKPPPPNNRRVSYSALSEVFFFAYPPL